jgi:oligo-1,6-glucosidase/alpha-glucosidase
VRDPQDQRQPGLWIGRDRSRTPMPWDASGYAGFSTVDPWLPLNEDWRVRNIAAQDRDTSSVLSLYRSLLALRRSHDALAIGDVTLVDAAEDVLAYIRRHAGESLLIALNLSDQMRTLTLPPDTSVADILASTVWPANLALRPMDAALAPDEGLILQLKEKR